MMSEVVGQRGGRSKTNRLVMEACADDYEEFSMVVSEIKKWTNCAPNAPTIHQIKEALIESIANKDLQAYEEHDCRICLTTVLPDHETTSELWFYVTEQGKKWVQEMSEFESNEVSTSENA
jgi:hypothetical protein